MLAPELGGARNITMEYYMDVAVCCFSVGNFNSAMSVLAGLNQVRYTPSDLVLNTEYLKQ